MNGARDQDSALAIDDQGSVIVGNGGGKRRRRDSS